MSQRRGNNGGQRPFLSPMLVVRVHLASAISVTVTKPRNERGPHIWINSKLIGPHGLRTSYLLHHRRCQRFLTFLSIYRHAHYSHLRPFFYGMCSKLGTLSLTLFLPRRVSSFTHFSLRFSVPQSSRPPPSANNALPSRGPGRRGFGQRRRTAIRRAALEDWTSGRD